LATHPWDRSARPSESIGGFLVAPLRVLGFGLALLHEARLGGTGERLAVLVDRLGSAGVSLALLQKTRLCGTGQRPAILVDGLGRAGPLRRGRAGERSVSGLI